jgi:hypothetical protein
MNASTGVAGRNQYARDHGAFLSPITVTPKSRLALARDGYALVKRELAVFKPDA